MSGLREQTEANDTLNYWSAIQKIDKTKSAITVQMNAWLFHILPRRAFDGQRSNLTHSMKHLEGESEKKTSKAEWLGFWPTAEVIQGDI